MKKNRLKQYWTPYWEWEDWLNGMWRTIPLESEESEYLKKAINFTGDWVKYGTAMEQVIHAWPRTMLNALTNPSLNKRAFLGHCACCYEFKCPEYIVRNAWKELTEQQRIDADAIAYVLIDQWTEKFNACEAR